ncbi:hypothetical protein VTJ04DRAFT_6533 [Mycothermus thermophilus]|uniref:uncharacterized protein n=1 Tax=Humicola insolens TaxID=85995 RepID=UPI0037449AD6
MSRLLLRPLRQSTALRSFQIPSARFASSFFQSAPAPPRLPPEQQAEFERLQRAAEAALSTHTQTPAASAESQPGADALTTSRHVSMPSTDPAQIKAATPIPPLPGTDTFTGGIRMGAPPEFEGDKNPKTGEIGGPKNEPLRWGPNGDWSFNGRVTDF